jgi:glycogen debranching enzyme
MDRGRNLTLRPRFFYALARGPGRCYIARWHAHFDQARLGSTGLTAGPHGKSGSGTILMIMNDLTSLRLSDLTERDWKVTNRLGAYASSSISLMNTRRSHGLLVAPITRGAQRLVLLSRVEECLKAPGRNIELACNQYPETVFPRGDQFLRGFDAESTPAWTYSGDGWTLEKRLHLLPDQNTVLLTWSLVEARVPFEFSIRPLFALRPTRNLTYQWNGRLSAEKRTRQDYRLPATASTPEVFFSSDGLFDPKGCWYYNTIYRGTDEGENGGLEDLWSPGLVQWTLSAGDAAHFVCSTEPVTLPGALAAFKTPAQRQVEVHVADIVRPAAKSDPDSPVNEPARTRGNATTR